MLVEAFILVKAKLDSYNILGDVATTWCLLRTEVFKDSFDISMKTSAQVGMVLFNEASTSGNHCRCGVGGSARPLTLLGKFAPANTGFPNIQIASFLSFCGSKSDHPTRSIYSL